MAYRLTCLVAAALCLGAPLAAQTSIDCSRAGDQASMNDCAHRGWEVSDAELNRLWRIVKPAADRAGLGAALLREQRAWLARRDATCNAERAQYQGGTIAPQVYWTCMDRMTIQRNGVLWALQ